MKALVMTQYNVEKGLELWGDRSVEAIDIELRQLHDRKVREPQFKHNLPPEVRRLALCYLMFLKEKRTGKMKGEKAKKDLSEGRVKCINCAPRVDLHLRNYRRLRKTRHSYC